LSTLLSPVAGNLEGHISHALREFKNSMEGNRTRSFEGFRASRVVSPSEPVRADWRPPATSRATGTFGGTPDDLERKDAVDYTRPPKPKYP